MNSKEMIELTDLEPNAEVVGGTKVGAGHLILPNANTYMGTTTVSASNQTRQAAGARWEQVITGDLSNTTF